MKRMLAIFGLVSFFSVAGFAGQPPGLEKKGKVPPGFEHGRKSGWQNEYPPGWDKKSDKEKKDWKQTVKKGREKVSTSAKEEGMTEEEAQSAADDFEKAARKGLDPEEAQSLVKDEISKGKKGKELSAAAADETEKRLNEKDQKDKKAKHKDKSRGKGKKK